MLKPIKKNIIVELLEKEKVTEGGIILASADREEVSKAKVLAIGDDVDLIEVGQVILPNWQKAKLTKFEDVDFYVVNEDDVVLIFEGE
jgi:co-chaperonin GroES (HSP10)